MLQITACLSTAAVNVQAVATDLRVCSLGIRKEMAEAKAPLPARTKLDQLQPFTQLTVKNLDKLAAVLDLPASPLLTPYSKDTPVVRSSMKAPSPAPKMEKEYGTEVYGSTPCDNYAMQKQCFERLLSSDTSAHSLLVW